MGWSVWRVLFGPLLDDQQGQMANLSEILTSCAVWMVDRAGHYRAFGQHFLKGLPFLLWSILKSAR